MAMGPNRAPGREDVPPSKGAPRITAAESAYVDGSSRSHFGTPRNVKSGPNCWPYRVMDGGSHPGSACQDKFRPDAACLGQVSPLRGRPRLRTGPALLG